MEKESKKHLSSIDGLRAVGAIMVFNLHFLLEYTRLHPVYNPLTVSIVRFFESEHFGVDLFFVLSGFLIFRSLLRHQYSAVTFAKQRAKRLLPANFFVLSILTFNNFNLIPFILNLFFLVPFFNMFPLYDYVSWSLNWELLFYIAIYIIFLIYKKFNFKYFIQILLISVTIVSIIFLLLSHSFPTSLSIPDPGRFSTFFLGALIAYIESKNFKYNKKFMTFGLFMSIVFIFISMLIWSNNAVQFTTLTYNIFFFLIGLSFSFILTYVINFKSFLNKILDSLPFRSLGNVSYSFYLIHPLLMPLAVGFLYKHNIFNFGVVYIIAVGACYLFALFMYTYLEKPYFHEKFKVNPPVEILQASK